MLWTPQLPTSNFSQTIGTILAELVVLSLLFWSGFMTFKEAAIMVGTNTITENTCLWEYK